MASSAEFRRVLRELKRLGLLLESDKVFPNVVALAAGGRVPGPRGGHPLARDVYGVAHPLREHADVIVTKLVSGKATYVHRRLWPAVVAAGTSRERWQLDELSPV